MVQNSIAATASTKSPSSARVSSPRSRPPICAPNCAPDTPPSSSSNVSTISTLPNCQADIMVTAEVTHTTWNSEVPITTAVGMPSR